MKRPDFVIGVALVGSLLMAAGSVVILWLAVVVARAGSHPLGGTPQPAR